MEINILFSTLLVKFCITTYKALMIALMLETQMLILRGSVYIPDRHHTEGDVLRRHVVRALDFVDFIRFCHHDAVMLKYHGVAVDSSL